MDVVFDIIGLFGLFFGIGGVVYGTEVSKRCQAIIAARFQEIDVHMSERHVRQDKAIKAAARRTQVVLDELEERIEGQRREIKRLEKALEPLLAEHRKRLAMEKKLAAASNSNGWFRQG